MCVAYESGRGEVSGLYGDGKDESAKYKVQSAKCRVQSAKCKAQSREYKTHHDASLHGADNPAPLVKV